MAVIHRFCSTLSRTVFKSLSQARVVPYLLIAFWLGMLLLSSNGQQSLMAHDEGNFAAEARFMVDSGHWLARQWWGQPVYTHGIALNWLIASSYTLLGQNDWTARLPSILSCLGAALLTYDIGKQVLPNPRTALVGALILGVMPLWFQYGRLATQDMPLVSLELLGIWGLLQAEKFPKYRVYWGLLAGAMVGLGFLMKSFMIVLPVVALIPYLIAQHRRHRHLFNPGLYLGLLLGLAGVGLWIGLSMATYGDVVWQQLFGKLTELGSEPFHQDGGRFYYLWNIPANAFPWPLFVLIGYGIGWRRRTRLDPLVRQSPYFLLIWGYPVVLLGLLTLFPTRAPYYPLQLYPFLALLSAIVITALLQSPWQWIGRLLSDGFGLLGLVLIVAAVLTSTGIPGVSLPPEVSDYQGMALVLGIGFALLPYWWRRQATRYPLRWIWGWLVPIWLTVTVAGFSGLLGNYTPDIKAALRTPDVVAAVADDAVDFVIETPVDGETHKTWVLLTLYTPQLGTLRYQATELPPNHAAWVSPKVSLVDAEPYQVITELRQWRLIQTR